MHYKHLNLAVSFLFGILCLTLIFLPELIYWLFQIQGSGAADILAKRAAMLFLGLTILCFYSRNSKSAEVRQLVALAVGCSMGALALLGIYELFQGTVGLGILVAVITEATITLLFYGQWAANRHS